MKLTVYFDGQFWAGLIEVIDDGKLAAGRHVFGAEPREEEVLAFVQTGLPALLDRLTPTVVASERDVCEEPRHNPKRAAREAAREARKPAVSTHAQAAMQAQHELYKQERRVATKAEKLAEAERQYQLAREKAKQKHRGH
jgi:hypothetical protein